MGFDGSSPGDDEQQIVAMLTERERQVLALLAHGLSAKEVAQRLGTTARTVESHIERARLKTRTRNATHMVAHALRSGIISFKE